MLLRDTTAFHIIQQIELLQPMENEAVMVLFAEQNTPDIPALIEALNKKNITFFGGIFPGLIYGKESIASGCILKKFKVLLKPFCTTGIAESQFNGFQRPDLAMHIHHGTAIVLLDGLTSNLSQFLEKLNDLLGEHCQFIGGGAGSISLEQSPCVFCNSGFEADAAVVCVLDRTVNLGVRHGWEHLNGPMVATKTDGNTIIQLNWQPAIDLYGSIVENDCNIALTPDNFGSIAQGYPFGILREKEDDIVRDPLAIGENGSIVCIGEVPTNTVLHVLKGNRSNLLKAALSAITDCSGENGLPLKARETFIVDCVTRTHFLGDQFPLELNIVWENLAIDNPQQEPFGLLSLGEISSYGSGLLEVFNKTIVIGAFY